MVPARLTQVCVCREEHLFWPENVVDSGRRQRDAGVRGLLHVSPYLQELSILSPKFLSPKFPCPRNFLKWR